MQDCLQTPPPAPPPGEQEQKKKAPDYQSQYGLEIGKYKILGRFTQKVTYFTSYAQSDSVSQLRHFWGLEEDGQYISGRFFGAVGGQKSPGIFIDIVAGTASLLYRYKNDNQSSEDPELLGFLFLSGFDNSEDEAFLRQRQTGKITRAD